ncbi:MAG TPA: hypothetical protein VHT91_27700 [Kofleriaceae bacterium]|jgi:hypothetical protein|nr:hypothetical protein [Kofleriaceae bacterium]
MYEPPAGPLTTLPAAALTAPPVEPGSADAAVMCGFAFTSMLSVILFLAGMPLISMAILAITGVSTIVLESAMSARRRRLGAGELEVTEAEVTEAEVTEKIVAIEARETYRAILTAYTEIRRVIGDAASLRSSRAAVLERCEAAVQQCGRLALLGNPLQRYLATHDRAQTRADLERLRQRSAAAGDALIGDALGRAATARARQLETHDQIIGMRDRIQARLELARAALESFAATIVKLRVAGDEHLVLSGESVIDHLDGVGDELEVLETELALDLALDLAA